MNRQAIDYHRLDATYDHWLLDEFQDTSRLQWNALRDLVDEVLQSDSGQRSFFYVGDTKQAIYGWRGGDPRLFTEIAGFLQRLRRGAHRHRRGTRDIVPLGAGNRPNGERDFLAGKSHLRRRRTWSFPRRHSADGTTRGASTRRIATSPALGCVQWKTVVPGEKGRAETLNAETAALLAEIDPIARGWSCAVLVRSNDRAASVINALRERGLAASSEGRFSPCTDNDLGTALLGALRAVAHPADTLSPRHLEMTPLSALPRRRNFRVSRRRAAGDRARRLCEDHPGLAGRGSAHGIREKPRGRFPGNRRRVRRDLHGKRRDRRLRFVRGKLHDERQSDTRTIRVMTIHGSKGLDFDMVVLPDLEGAPLPSRKDTQSVFLRRDEQGDVLWGLDLPRKDVCAVDDELRSAYEQDAADDCYENPLRVLRGDDTRAARALSPHEPQKEDTTSKDFNRLLHDSLERTAGEYVCGNPNWHRSGQKNHRPRGSSPHWHVHGEERNRGRASLRIAAPARRGEIFRGAAGRTLGSEIPSRPGNDRMDRRGGAAIPGIGAARGGNRQAASEKAESRFFTKPKFTNRLWREREFDVLIDGRRISGRFDRVVLELKSGQVTAAEIIDFKTEESPGGAEAHRTQLEGYRAALAALTGLAHSSIAGRVIGVPSGESARVF